MGIRSRIADWIVENSTLTPTTTIDGSHLVVPRGEITTLHSYSALYSVAYMACEQTKARSVGSLPVSVYSHGEGGREIHRDNALARLLNGHANELMTGQDLLAWTVLRRDTFGDAFWWVEWRRDKPMAIFPITAHVDIDYDRAARPGRRVRYIVREGTMSKGVAVTVPAGRYFADEVIHIKTAITKDGVNGESIARRAAQDVGLSVDLERFYSSMLRNGNHQLGHVEVPEIRKQEQLDSLKRAIEAKRGVDNAGETPIFGFGAKWVTDQQTMKDASLIEQQAWVLQQVCRATNVPPQKVYDATRQTYNNAESARIDYATDTITPEVREIERALQPVLDSMGLDDHYVRFDLNGLMRGDSAARGQYYREMVYSGVYTRADIRELEDKPPIEGLDKPLVPLNYAVMEPDGTYTVLSKDASEPADGMQTGTTDEVGGQNV